MDPTVNSFWYLFVALLKAHAKRSEDVTIKETPLGHDRDEAFVIVNGKTVTTFLLGGGGITVSTVAEGVPDEVYGFGEAEKLTEFLNVFFQTV